MDAKRTLVPHCLRHASYSLFSHQAGHVIRYGVRVSGCDSIGSSAATSALRCSELPARVRAIATGSCATHTASSTAVVRHSILNNLECNSSVVCSGESAWLLHTFSQHSCERGCNWAFRLDRGLGIALDYREMPRTESGAFRFSPSSLPLPFWRVACSREGPHL